MESPSPTKDLSPSFGVGSVDAVRRKWVLFQIELQFKTSFLRGCHDCKLTTAQEGKMEPSTSTSVKNIGVLLKLAAYTDNICIDALRFCRILCQKKNRQ